MFKKAEKMNKEITFQGGARELQNDSSIWEEKEHGMQSCI